MLPEHKPFASTRYFKKPLPIYTKAEITSLKRKWNQTFKTEIVSLILMLARGNIGATTSQVLWHFLLPLNGLTNTCPCRGGKFSHRLKTKFFRQPYQCLIRDVTVMKKLQKHIVIVYCTIRLLGLPSSFFRQALIWFTNLLHMCWSAWPKV